MREEIKMKKFKFIFLVCLLALFPLVFAGCGKTALGAPTGVNIDDDLKLSWQSVKGARSYEVEIQNADGGIYKTEKTRKAYISLTKVDEGDYVIRVKAVADEKDKENKDSEWSAAIEFQKGYETGCIYKLIHNGTEYELIRAGTSSGTFTIADTFRGKPVVSIGDGAFNGSGRVQNVEVTGSFIQSVGNNAFYNCSKLESIVLPDSVNYLGERAFQSCRMLKNARLPSKLKEILSYTFAYCGSLESITLPDSLVYIGESAFSDCVSLKEIAIPAGVKSVGDYAFASCSVTTTGENDEVIVSGLEKVTFGNAIQTIGKYAFSKSAALKTVTFAADCRVQTIDDSAFEDCTSLASIELPVGLTTIGDNAFSLCKKLNEISIPSTVTRVGDSAFTGTAFYSEAAKTGNAFIYADKWLVGVTDAAKKLTTITGSETVQPDAKLRLSNAVVGFADAVFMSATDGSTFAFTSVTFPDSLKYIGNYAFVYCKKLTRINSLTDNAKLTQVGDYAFYGCTDLTKVNFKSPKAKGSLKRIGACAFYNCPLANNASLVPDSVNSIGQNAFKGTELWKSPDSDGLIYANNWVVGYSTLSNAMVTFKNGTRGIADYAFDGCADIKSANMANVTFVGRGAFANCENLTNAYFNVNLTSIADYAFYKCTSLNAITFPKDLTKIGRSAFYKCSSLTRIDLSRAKVTELGEYAFYDCKNLQNLLLCDTLEEIPAYAFYGCTALKELTVPASIKTIGERAFYKSSALTSLTFAGDENSLLESIGDSAFYGSETLARIDLPQNIVTLGNKAFYNCVNAEYITLGGVQNIGEYAFYGAAALKELSIPESVKSIGKFAFKGASLVKSVIVPDTLEVMGAHVFYGMKDATFYSNASGIKGEWDKYWNSSFRPVVWNATLSEDKTYVVSITVSAGNFTNANALGGIGDPVRSGMKFLGWAKTENGEAEIESGKITEVEDGTVLYAVWGYEE